MFRLFAAALAASALFASQPNLALAQASSDELAALAEQLPGKLVNDPSRIDWDSYGPSFHAESFQDENLPGGAARRFHVNSSGGFIYSAGAKIPLTKSVKRGEQVTIGFYARTVESSESDGRGVIRVRFQRDVDPYPGYGEKTLSIGSEWEWYEVTAKADTTLRSKFGIVVLQFGATKQILEIGQAIVVSGASAIASNEPSEPTAKPEPEPQPTGTLPPPLENAGILLNNPNKGDWAFPSDQNVWEALEDTKLWGATVTRLASTSAQTSETLAPTVRIPVGQPIAEGDDILIAIAARTEATSSPGGNAVLRVQLGDRSVVTEPFSDNRVGFGTNWQLLRVKTKAPRNLPAGTTELVLRLDPADQTIDLGPVYVIKTN